MGKYKRVVLAIGGNALLDPKGGKSAKFQLEKAKGISTTIIDLVEEGYELVLVHGNGPQVGQIFAAHQLAQENSMPLAESTAMSQGYIGYHLQNTITNEAKRRNLSNQAITVISQIEVDRNDEKFNNPDKPIGFNMNKDEADSLKNTYGYSVREDLNGGWRRVVPSPIPVNVVELDLIRSLVEAGYITIAAGGGGIPVVKEKDGSYSGVDAVIDKDYAALKLAIELDADYFLLLTSVEKVALDYGTPNQRDMDKLTVEEGKKLMDQGVFEAGSILPKVHAACLFADSKPDGAAIITSLDKCKEALAGETGTRIY